MRTVDLIHQKRDGEELSPEDIATLVDGYLSGEIPDYQMSSFLMATYFSGMSDREVSAMTERMIASGETIDLSSLPGVKSIKFRPVGDKTSLVAAPLAVARRSQRSHDRRTRSRNRRARWTNWKRFRASSQSKRGRIYASRGA
jgi:thymidine phosphorylase